MNNEKKTNATLSTMRTRMFGMIHVICSFFLLLEDDEDDDGLLEV